MFVQTNFRYNHKTYVKGAEYTDEVTDELIDQGLIGKKNPMAVEKMSAEAAPAQKKVRKKRTKKA